MDFNDVQEIINKLNSWDKWDYFIDNGKGEIEELGNYEVVNISQISDGLEASKVIHLIEHLT